MANSYPECRKRVTSYDVARLAGVSQSAVSRAFRPGLSVSEITKAKVMKAARKLGYKPNAIARMLITQRTSLVAVIISSVSDPLYPELLSRVTDHLAEHDQQVLLFTLDDPKNLEALLEQIWSFQVDGIIAMSAHIGRADISLLEQDQVPVVLCNQQLRDHPVNTVCVDHRQGIQQLVELLTSGSSKRFLVLSGPIDSDLSNERREIALRHLLTAGFNDVPVVYGDFSYDSGKECFAQWMQEHEAPDAVICSNDTMAIGCIDEARDEHDIAIPEMMSIVGFDGLNAAFWAAYDLTTIRQPVDQLASAAVDILMERIDHPDYPPEHRVLAGTVIKGKTVGN